MSEIPRTEAVLGTKVTLLYELDIEGTPVDPAKLTLLVRSRQGDAVSVPDWTGTDDVITKDSAGRLHADVIPGSEGDWLYRFAGFDALDEPLAATEGEFRVYSLLR
jgi:hypothetical protein